MSLPRQTYYDVLGVLPTATGAEIKKKYRELARRFHPDVSKSPDAAVRFKEINEANRVLSDPDARARYDFDLNRARRPASPSPAQPTPPAEPPRPASSTTSAGTSATGARPGSGSTSGGASTGSARRGPGASEFQQLMAEAHKAMSRMRYREAESFCRQALRIDRRSSTAYEILGDIQQKRGRADDAVAMYSYALQLDRNNRSVQMKFDKMVGRTSGPTMAGNAGRAARGASTTRGRVASPAGPSEPANAGKLRWSATVIGVVGVLLLLGVVLTMSSPAARSVWIADWDPLVIFALAASGGFTGFLLVLNGVLGDAKAELGGPRGAEFAARTGVTLVVAALALFYASFLIYLGIAAIKGRVSPSILAGYAAAVILTILFALATHIGTAWILLCGGNLVFPCLIGGWLLGSGYRSR